MADLAVWPTDGGDGAVSSEARWRKMARLWANSGVKFINSDLVPTLVAGPVIDVSAGQCWIDGHLCELDVPVSVPVTSAGLLVVRFTPADNHAELVYLDGVTVPVQTDATWELPIALMSGGALYDRRIMAVGGLASIIANPVTTAVTALNPTYGTIPGMQMVLWHPGEYLLTAQFDMEIATAAAGNLAYVSPSITSGASACQFSPSGMTVRQFISMAQVWRDTRFAQYMLRILRPAEVVCTGQACKGAATGVFNIIGATGATWLAARRVG